MGEKRPIIDKERITYEGLFSLKEVMGVIKSWISDKGYFPLEKKHTESIKTEGKHVEIELAPFKKVTDYAKNAVIIKILCTDLKEVTVEIDGKKKKLNQGKLQIILDAFLETDYEGRWEQKAIFYVLRTIFEKYVYTPFLSGFETNLRADVDVLRTNIKGYLNLFQYYK